MTTKEKRLDPKLLSMRLECIAETIQTRPVLGHWPAMQAHIDAHAVLQARDEIDLLRAALLGAVQAIQTWHNMGMSGNQASSMWDIYWRNAPEMQPIREALSGDAHGT
jgi:hypothetical protein